MQAPCPSAFAGQEGPPQLDHLVASGWNHTVVISRDCKTVFQSGSCAAVPGDGVLHNPLQAVVFGENVALCSIAAGEQHRQAYQCSVSMRDCPAITCSQCSGGCANTEMADEMHTLVMQHSSRQEWRSVGMGQKFRWSAGGRRDCRFSAASPASHQRHNKHICSGSS